MPKPTLPRKRKRNATRALVRQPESPVLASSARASEQRSDSQERAKQPTHKRKQFRARSAAKQRRRPARTRLDLGSSSAGVPSSDTATERQSTEQQPTEGTAHVNLFPELEGASNVPVYGETAIVPGRVGDWHQGWVDDNDALIDACDNRDTPRLVETEQGSFLFYLYNFNLYFFVLPLR